MRRGEIWTVAGGGDYTGKPRPVVVIQDDQFDATSSVTICALTGNAAEVPLVRPVVEPTEQNGLRSPSRIMVDKITTVRRERLGRSIGALGEDDLMRLNRAIIVFLGLAGGSSPRRGTRRGGKRKTGAGRSR